jgi:Ca2+-binding EF-hand superfamily protein
LAETYSLQEALIAMGQNPTDEDLAEMFLELDHDNSGGIDFAEFVQIITRFQQTATDSHEERDTCAGSEFKRALEAPTRAHASE